MKWCNNISFSQLFVGILILFCLSCREKSNDIDSVVPDVSGRDLNQILDDGQLTLITENSSTSYYLYRGQPVGYDYDLFKKFADDMGINMKILVMSDLNEMFEALNNGEGDVISCNLTITNERRNQIIFSDPLLETRQVLIQRKPEGWRKMRKRELESAMIRSPLALSGRTIYVHESSSFHQRLINLQEETGQDFDIRLASGDLDSETLIRMVAEGLIDFTVADENVAMLNQTYYPELDVKTGLSFSQQIGVGMRLTADSLQAVFNMWLQKNSVKQRRAYLYEKYFRAVKDQKDRVFSEFSSLKGNQISQYDDELKRVSSSINWDWRLLAALIYQESRFNPHAKSWAGAFGLMQLMPQTAMRFGIDTTQTEIPNIEAGVMYIDFLEGFWENKVEDPVERQKFVLASYNVGPGHVLDAQKIADHLGLNRQVWDNNVADCLLLKTQEKYYQLEGVKHGYCRGEEPFAYVRNILSHYEHFVQNIN